MWIVANQLKGVLRFPAMNVEIAPGAEYDLDVLGRDRADASEQVKVALENNYLRTVRKTVMLDEAELSQLIEDRIRSIKTSLVTEINELYQDKGVARV